MNSEPSLTKRITQMSQIRKMMATPPLLLFERQSNLWFRKLLALAGCPAWDDSGHFLLRTLFIIFHYFILATYCITFVPTQPFLAFLSRLIIPHSLRSLTHLVLLRCSRSVSFDIAILFILFLPLLLSLLSDDIRPFTHFYNVWDAFFFTI